jgi:hypothetical protein
MTAVRINDREFMRQYAEAKKRGEEKMAHEPQARAVHYDRATKRVIVDLKNGTTFIFPTKLVQGLKEASPQDIEDVRLGPRGAALYWDRIGVDFSLGALMAGIFGTRIWMVEHARKAGSVRSRAKAAAARANGAKGGRPRRDTRQKAS